MNRSLCVGGDFGFSIYFSFGGCCSTGAGCCFAGSTVAVGGDCSFAGRIAGRDSDCVVSGIFVGGIVVVGLGKPDMLALDIEALLREQE